MPTDTRVTKKNPRRMRPSSGPAKAGPPPARRAGWKPWWAYAAGGLVVALGIVLAVTLTSSSPGKSSTTTSSTSSTANTSSGLGTGKGTHRQQVAESLTRTVQIYNNFLLKNRTCPSTACIDTVALNSLDAEGNAANLFNQLDFSGNARTDGQNYAQTLIDIQRTYELIAQARTHSAIDSYLGSLRAEFNTAKNQAAITEAALS